MKKYLIVFGVSLLLMACASQNAKNTAQNDQAQNGPIIIHGTKPPKDKNLVCSRSHPMDSHIPELICVTPEQAAARKKATQNMMQTMQNGPSPAVTGGTPPGSL